MAGSATRAALGSALQPVCQHGEGASLTQSTAWRGKRQDITGYYYLGARYYEPSSARFLSTDPMGHGASMSLYDYAGGDPINFVDPTGRMQTLALVGRSLGYLNAMIGLAFDYQGAAFS